jgi:hypothetical protein
MRHGSLNCPSCLDRFAQTHPRSVGGNTRNLDSKKQINWRLKPDQSLISVARFAWRFQQKFRDSSGFLRTKHGIE